MSIFDAITNNDNNLLVKLLNENISLEHLNCEFLTCFELAIRELENQERKNYFIASILIGHPWTMEKMLLTCLQYKMKKNSPSQRMVYKYLFMGCKFNLSKLVSFILQNFNINYSIYQGKDKCLDMCINNSCFQVFLNQKNTRFLAHIYQINKFILPLTNNFNNSPYKEYLYRNLYLACIHKSVDFIKYVTQNFIIDLKYNPYSKVSYFDLVIGTDLYQILLNYSLQNKVYSNNLTEQDKIEINLLSQFDS